MEKHQETMVELSETVRRQHQLLYVGQSRRNEFVREQENDTIDRSQTCVSWEKCMKRDVDQKQVIELQRRHAEQAKRLVQKLAQRDHIIQIYSFENNNLKKQQMATQDLDNREQELLELQHDLIAAQGQLGTVNEWKLQIQNNYDEGIKRHERDRVL